MSSYEALLQQLHSGSPSAQHRATVAVSVLPLTPQNWLSAVGVIPHLVQLLHSASTAAHQVQAIRRLLTHIVISTAHLDALVLLEAPDGVIPPLVSLLLLPMHKTDADTQYVLALTLSNLAVNAINQRRIMEAGAVAPLVQLLRSSSERLRFASAQAISFLVENSGARAQIIAAGAIVPLLQLFSSSAEALQLTAATAIRTLASTNAGPVAAAGGVPRLVQLLKSSSADVLEEAVEALRIISCDDGIKAQVASAGAIPLLAGLLRTSGSIKVQQAAALTLGNQIFTPQPDGEIENEVAVQSEIVAAGAVEPLIQMLRSGPEERQAAAAHALVCLSVNNSGAQAQIAAAGAIAPLICLLKAPGSAVLHARAALVLANLAPSYATAVVRAGALPVLVERLTAGPMHSREQAALALECIAKDSSSHAALLAAAPLLPLVHILTSGSAAARKFSLSALTLLHKATGFSAQFIAVGAVPLLAQMLCSDSFYGQHHAVTVLRFLSGAAREGPSSGDFCASIKNAGVVPLLARLQRMPGSTVMSGKIAEVVGILEALMEGVPAAAGYEEGGAAALASPAVISTSAPASSAAVSTSAPASSAVISASAPASSAAVSTSAPALAVKNAAPTSSASVSPSSSAASQQQPSRPRKSCWSCGAAGVPLKKCSVCAVAAYCGAGCQKADWKEHKGQCAGLKAGASGSGSSAAGKQ